MAKRELRSKGMSAATVFGWPGKMTAEEEVVFQASLLFDPSGQTLVQVARPFSTLKKEDFTRLTGVKSTDELYGNILITELKDRGARKFMFLVSNAGDIIDCGDYYRDMGYNANGIPDTIREKTMVMIQELDALYGNKIVKAAKHVRGEDAPFQFQRYATFLQTLGRRYQIEHEGATVRKVNRKSYDPEQQRGSVPAASETPAGSGDPAEAPGQEGNPD